ncbi:bifunctional UDP-sugar hydrolase/5'-nucleotidase [Siminovitchia sp. FSL W7-1587]|uniref:bifunctional metallophosphatase/5'-nucleotidase n=1 Tax=Siminovitchia sp. FSL W7-1587 TaxID=2954699 RepID=UPI0030CF8D52
MKEKVHIYHTNDIHSHLENWPRINHFLVERREAHEADGEDVFIFDCGDFVDRWHPFTEGTKGKGNVTLINEAGYTAVTIGNNEGMTLDHRSLNELYSDAQFDIVLANLFLPEGKRPAWALPRQIYMTSRGTKIGVTGVTAYYHRLYKLLDWELTEPLHELSKQIELLRKEADVIIVLSHLGLQADRWIAENEPGVDLILGGHTHHVLPNGEPAGAALLGAAGRYGEYVGYVAAEWEIEDVSAKTFNATLFETAYLAAPPDETEQMHEWREIGKKLLSTEVVSLPNPLTYSWDKNSELPAMLAEALYHWCGADGALVNSGLFLAPLDEGQVTKYDIHQMLPHPINPCLVELDGGALREVLYQAEETQLPQLTFKGLGFRGVMMGKFVYHHIEADFQNNILQIGGKPLNLEETYKIATIDTFTFGKFFPQIQHAQMKTYYLPEFLRDVMEWHLIQLYK